MYAQQDEQYIHYRVTPFPFLVLLLPPERYGAPSWPLPLPAIQPAPSLSEKIGKKEEDIFRIKYFLRNIMNKHDRKKKKKKKNSIFANITNKKEKKSFTYSIGEHHRLEKKNQIIQFLIKHHNRTFFFFIFFFFNYLRTSQTRKNKNKNFQLLLTPNYNICRRAVPYIFILCRMAGVG